MYFDRCDIVGAWYLALSDCHRGQWSPEYARLCKLLNLPFSPSPFFSVNSLTENGRIIYDAACARLLGTEAAQ